MTRTSATRCSGPEYVTDWRVVYSVIVVVVTMVAGVLAWALHTPTNRVPFAMQAINAKATDADAVANAEELAGQMPEVEIVSPWAPLPPETRLPSEVLPLSPRDTVKTVAKPDTEKSNSASVDNGSKQTHAVGNAEEASEIPDFIDDLESVVTLDFNPIKATSNPKQSATQVIARRLSEPLTQEQQFRELANQADLAGLPILGEDKCLKSAEEIKELANVSRRMSLINRNRGAQEADFFSLSQESDLEEEVFKFIKVSELDAHSVAPLVQILQVSTVGVRMMLVDALSGIEGPEASRALADRAIFDLSRDVRSAATESLKCRNRNEYQPRLLHALRYPLAAVSFHAAETLVALGDTDVLPSLKELLDEPDPSKPFVTEDGTLRKIELVRVNHLRNCLLCHPRAGSRNDKVRGAIPTPGQPLPRSYGGSSLDTVRADVTYLRQDFSVVKPVIARGSWPEMQRFDFLVRTRSPTEEEIQEQTDFASASSKVLGSYPQREAVLSAINRLAKPGS